MPRIEAEQVEESSSAFVGLSGLPSAGDGSDSATTGLADILSTPGDGGLAKPLQATSLTGGSRAAGAIVAAPNDMLERAMA